MKEIDDRLNFVRPLIGVEVRVVFDSFDLLLCLFDELVYFRLGLYHHAGNMIVPRDDAGEVVLLFGELAGVAAGLTVGCIGCTAGPDAALEGFHTLVLPRFLALESELLQPVGAFGGAIVQFAFVGVWPSSGFCQFFDVLT